MCSVNRLKNNNEKQQKQQQLRRRTTTTITEAPPQYRWSRSCALHMNHMYLMVVFFFYLSTVFTDSFFDIEYILYHWSSTTDWIRLAKSVSNSESKKETKQQLDQYSTAEWIDSMFVCTIEIGPDEINLKYIRTYYTTYTILVADLFCIPTVIDSICCMRHFYFPLERERKKRLFLSFLFDKYSLYFYVVGKFSFQIQHEDFNYF